MKSVLSRTGRYLMGALVAGVAITQFSFAQTNSSGNTPLEMPVITVTAPNAEAAERAVNGVTNTATFTLWRAGDATKELNVNYVVSGTASNGLDYLKLTSPARIAAGARSTDIIIRPLDDGLVEGTETVILNLKPGDFYRVGSPSNATVSIINSSPPVTNPAPTITILSPTNGTAFTAPATIDIQAKAVDPHGYIAALDFYEGTNKIGRSEIWFFRAPDPGTPIVHHMTWQNVPAGQYTLTAKTIDAAGNTIASQPIHISVNAPSLPVVTVKATTPATSEASSKPGVFTVYRTGDTNSALTVLYQFLGTAKNGTDYAQTPASVTIPAKAASTNIQIKPLVNLKNEADKVVLLILSKSDHYKIGSPSNAVVTIEDSDRKTNSPPVCAITSPKNGAVMVGPTNLTLMAQASDRDGWIQKVDFYFGTTKVGTVTNSALIWPEMTLFSRTISNLPPGQYTLSAKATDNRGLKTTSAVVKITIQAKVEPTNIPPVITIISPVTGASFTAPTNITFKMEASDKDGWVQKVELLEGTHILAFKTNSLASTHLFSLVWSNAASGQFTLLARATDNKGAAVNSSTVNIKVNPPVPASFVTRQLPTNYTPGMKLTVRLEAKPRTSTVVYALEDQPPAGWTVSAISNDGVFDPVSKKVKFGAFFDSTARTLTYDTTPPLSEKGTKQFAGIASADGTNSPITGQSTINELVVLYHPADNNPKDFVLTLNELTAYSLAWKKGQTWPIGPNPIPLSYVTRAAVLWRGGETYRFDPTLGEVPNCWVNVQPARPQALDNNASLNSKLNTAVCELTRNSEHSLAIPVKLTVTPQAGVTVFALEDQLPPGWTAATITEDGQFDAVNRQVKWLFMDGRARVLTYQAMPPVKFTGTATFTGMASYANAQVGLQSPISGQRQVSLVGGTTTARVMSVAKSSGNAVQLTLIGIPGASHLIEASSDLINWTPVGTVVPTDTQFNFEDPEATSLNHRFYRVRLVN